VAQGAAAKGPGAFDAVMEKARPVVDFRAAGHAGAAVRLPGQGHPRQPLIIALLAVPILIQVFFNSALAYWLNRAVGEKHNVACPSALIGASNFFELAVAAAISLFGFESGAALATVVGVLIEVPVMLLVVKVVNASKGWYALAAHVLLCLVPAFFIAGALSALVPQASITRYLGPDAPRWVAYPAAAGAGSLLAVCSCTVQPLFAGIYGKGAGLGPAITFLFFAPAANILALSYTGVALGAEIAIARIVLALSFGIGIGMIMAMIFRRSEAARQGDARAFAGDGRVPGRTLLFLGTLVALLIAGTLKVDLLTATLWQHSMAWPEAAQRAGAARSLGAGQRSYRRRRHQPAGGGADRAARADRRRRMARPRPDRQRREPAHRARAGADRADAGLRRAGPARHGRRH
jgi:hypothetical protein